MNKIGWLISKYLVQAIVPYFVFSWLLLTVILFVQQASRFADIFFSVNIPANLVWQLTLALVPNVIAFTCPMAVLVGTIIGLSKMRGDSELVAIRAAGVGNLQIAVPIVLLGSLLSVFAFLVNLQGVPFAARLVRNVALQSAIKKLESPIEPGVFNTEIAGFTIYVKGGDIETGRWNNIFIYNEDAANGTVRLITSKRGRIDTTDQFSEMVLENASVSTIPRVPGAGKYVTENIGDIRLAIKTRRSELLERLTVKQGTPEELGLSELSDFANSSQGADKVEAQILLQRRILLSVSPLIFCLLGAAMILRFNRGGRGFGIFLALIVLIGYYLLTFLGEQLARTGKISVIVGGLIPVFSSALAVLIFSISPRTNIIGTLTEAISNLFSRNSERKMTRQARNIFVDVTTGLRDFDLISDLVKYFFLALGFLTAIFMIFTAFELWRFAGVIPGGAWLLARYLFFLIPFVYLQIAPSAAMIATIATYVIKSRQNEIVTWTSAGQSVYRLMIPCFFLTVLLGVFNWGIQETVTPFANRSQDGLRSLIRKGGVSPNASGKIWVANDKRIYSFELVGGVPPRSGMSNPWSDADGDAGSSAIASSASDNEMHFRRSLQGTSADPRAALNMSSVADQAKWIDSRSAIDKISDHLIKGAAAGTGVSVDIRQAAVAKDSSASDNEMNPPIIRPTSGGGGNFYGFLGASPASIVSASDNETGPPCSSVCVKDLTVYEFADNDAGLQTVYRSRSASWINDRIVFNGSVEIGHLNEGKIVTEIKSGGELAEIDNPFTELGGKPSHMTIGELKREIATSDSDVGRRSFAVALEKRYSTVLLPLVIALFTAPFALSIHRSSRVVTVGYAIGLWLVYTGVTYVFEEFGLNGFISPAFSVYSPVAIFSMLGVYLLSKVRT